MLMLTCWYYRRIISGCLDSNYELPARLGKHLRQCSSCRGFHDASVGLGEQLLADADAERQVPSPFLEGRIVASLGEDRPQTVRTVFRPAWSAAAAVLALVLSGVLFLRHEPGLENSAGSGAAAPRKLADGAGLLVAAVRLPVPDELREWTKKLNQPLETELQSVIQDARTALDLLAYNFCRIGLRRNTG